VLKTRVARGWIAVFLLGIVVPAEPATAKVPIAVIVHQQVPVDDLSLAELRRIFLGERRSWSRDVPITLLMPPEGSPERRVLLKWIYGERSEVQVQHYWINKLFGDEAPIAPKITGSDAMSASLARVLPGAIALVPADKVPREVKVLRIDGKLPGDSGYPLVASGRRGEL
jgi:hypothetical protein